MSSGSNAESLKQIDEKFLKSLKIGDRLFHYPPKGSGEESFQDSPSAEYTLYSVIDLPTETDLVLIRAFDEKEIRENMARSRLLAGDWWYNPEF